MKRLLLWMLIAALPLAAGCAEKAADELPQTVVITQAPEPAPTPEPTPDPAEVLAKKNAADYIAAAELLQNGDLSAAADAFDALGDYADSADRAAAARAELEK